jgi:preprotein translocase subunit SecG
VIAYILYTLFVISCFILILVVLLQPGKGDAASALGGGVSGAAFGPRGTTTLLAKITIGAAVAFMAIAFMLSVPGLVINRSVTAGVEAPATQDQPDQPAAPAPDGAAPAAPNGAVPAGSITIDQNGNMQTAPPQQTPAPAADQKPEAKPESKPETKSESKSAADTKKPAAEQKKQ